MLRPSAGMSQRELASSTLRNLDQDGALGAARSAVWSLIVLACDDPERINRAVPLPNIVAIGRMPPPGPNLQIADPTVSRFHVALQLTAARSGFRLIEQGSRNGTFVNGERLEHDASVEIGDGSVVRLGDALFVLRRGERTPPSEVADLGLLGSSPEMAELRTIVRRVGPSSLSVLISGPTGSGKELVARALHAVSGRGGPLVTLNCAALPGPLTESLLFGHRRGAFTGATSDQDGAMRRADGGTLLLDEVGDMPLEIQPKLLRALETGEILPLGAAQSVQVNVRIVAATHVALEDAVAEGRFREDLLARLCGVVLKVPPLWQRRDDVLSLFRHFLPPAQREIPLSPTAAEALLLYSWPRNVRELQKLAERIPILHPDAKAWRLEHLGEPFAVAVGEEPRSAHPPALASPPNREELLALLSRHRGNVTKVAEAWGRNRKQVYRWMDAFGIGRGTGRQ